MAEEVKLDPVEREKEIERLSNFKSTCTTTRSLLVSSELKNRSYCQVLALRIRTKESISYPFQQRVVTLDLAGLVAEPIQRAV
jgi:hypothetical protein